MQPYCEYCLAHPEDVFNHDYHANHYGFPLRDDALLFERLMFEINQAGLSWITILKKADNFRRAYDEDGMTPGEFDHYGATARTLRTFIEHYHELQGIVRDAMIPNPDKG